MKEKKTKKKSERGKEKKEKTAQKRRSHHIASLSATTCCFGGRAFVVVVVVVAWSTTSSSCLAAPVSFSSPFCASSVRRGVLSRKRARISFCCASTVPLNGQKERDEKMEHRNHHHHGPTTRRQALGEINGNTARENAGGKNALAATKRGYVFRSRFEILLYSR